MHGSGPERTAETSGMAARRGTSSTRTVPVMTGPSQPSMMRAGRRLPQLKAYLVILRCRGADQDQLHTNNLLLFLRNQVP